MKRILLAVAMLSLIFPALRQAEARTDISVDFFYDNMGDGGNWIEAGEYGYCWQPTVASNASWRPYSDGYWAYTDVGWTWVSYEDFGWATYHYGRWVKLRGRGWIWAPGREWGPAWVSWRTGGDYVGWAPLPPRRGGDIYVDFSPITSRVDIDYDIGPAYYNFIDVRYIGEPVLRERIFAADQNVTYVSKTVNVTNITYNNSQVYNYGPDYNTLSRYSTRPIQKLTLQRENTDPLAAARSKSLMKVQGDKLVIAAPQQLQKPTKTIAPKMVKEKIAKPAFERGWDGADPKAQAELREKMKKEDPKSVPPPTVQASEKAETSPAATAPGATTASATPATTTASPSVSANASPAATGTPATAASPSASPTKDKNKRDDKVSPAPGASPSVSPAMTPEKNKNRQRDNVAPSASVPPATGATETTAPSVAPKPPKEKPEKRKVEPAAVPPPLDAPKSAPRVAPPPPPPETKRNQPGPDATKPEAAVEKPKKEPPSDIPKPKKEQAPPERMAPPPPAANAPVNPPPPRDEGKEKDKNVPASSPTP